MFIQKKRSFYARTAHAHRTNEWNAVCGVNEQLETAVAVGRRSPLSQLIRHLMLNIINMTT